MCMLPGMELGITRDMCHTDEKGMEKNGKGVSLGQREWKQSKKAIGIRDKLFCAEY